MANQILLHILALTPTAFALVSPDGVTGRLPAMGWNSWNEYQCDINETVFLDVSKAIVDLGLKDLGYVYINIDDCWSNKTTQRDNATGKILPDLNKFPQGIKHTADEIHKLGLKLGIYGDAGTGTCAQYAGSLGHEEIDANTFAEWGIDYLKYDNCFVPTDWYDPYRWWADNWLGGPPHENQSAGGLASNLQGSYPIPAPAGYDWSTSKTFTRYKTMSTALLSVPSSPHTTIQFSQCAWGHARIDTWGNTTGHSWRMFGDINPVWTGKPPGAAGIMPILNHASFFHNASDFWGHADWDMLEVGNGMLTLEESRSHFALWAALKSPLIIGAKLTSIKPEILNILKNRDLIAFNQDSVVGSAAAPYKWGVNPDYTWNETHPAEYWSGEAATGVHVFVLNTLEGESVREVVFGEVPGLNAFETYTVRDLWTGEETDGVRGVWSATVKRHDTLAIRVFKGTT